MQRENPGSLWGCFETARAEKKYVTCQFIIILLFPFAIVIILGLLGLGLVRDFICNARIPICAVQFVSSLERVTVCLHES